MWVNKLFSCLVIKQNDEDVQVLTKFFYDYAPLQIDLFLFNRHKWKLKMFR